MIHLYDKNDPDPIGDDAETFEGNAIVYCQGAFGTTNGKTAHGLVRRSRRYRLLAVIDSRHAGQDAGRVLDDRDSGIPVVADLSQAMAVAVERDLPATHFVIGLAPDGGRLSAEARASVITAIRSGLHVVAGLHDYLSVDSELAALARQHHVRLLDVRKPPPREELHFFDGRIEQVRAFKVAVLGTDSAVGKRTTAWLLVDALRAMGVRCQLIGTGQTAWLQGARYGLVLDSLINDFVAGEIEYAIWQAWSECSPDVIVIEGQGSLMNPAYPGGFEIMAAGRPDGIVVQHAPARKEYDGFPGHPIQPLEQQIQVIELLSGRPVLAITINHENLSPAAVATTLMDIERRLDRPAFDVLLNGARPLASLIRDRIRRRT